MGNIKKIAGLLLAVCMAVTILAVPNTQAYAKATVSKKNVSISVGSQYTNQIEVIYSKGDAQLKNIRTNSKNLIARQVYQYYHEDEYSYADYPYGYARIGLYAKKEGSYKVSFDVCNAAGKKVSSHTVNVKTNATYQSPIQKATFAGKPMFYELTSRKSGKFKVKMSPGYKLKSIEMSTYDADGSRMITKKIKNNAKVTLGKYAYKNEDEYSYTDYDYETDTRTSVWNYHLNTGFFAETRFSVTYQNTKTKATGTMTYWVYTMPQN